MIDPQFILPLHHELVLDFFAGGGGASTGIEIALRRHVDHAINHDPIALGMHRNNHPQTVHHCEDVYDVDPLAVTGGRPVGLAWFSPDCKHHSKAKGGKPVDKRIRGLVLVMLRWCKHAPPRVICMENVEEISKWGPLYRVRKNGNWGWYPNPRYEGRTWKAFLACLSTGIKANHPDLPEILSVLGGTVTKEDLVKGFGYKFDYRERRAANAGAPTIRKRLYMIARRDGRPIIWPEQTHAEPRLLKELNKTRTIKIKPWRTIAECIDWSIHCPSIFLTKAEAKVKGLNVKRPLADASLRRIAKGMGRYVINTDRPFLVSLTHQGGDRVESIDEPIRTITGANRGEKGVVAPVMTKYHGSHEGRADGDERHPDLQEPLPTQDTSNRFSLVAPVVVNSANSKTTGRGPNAWTPGEPMRTATASPSFNIAEAALAGPFITEHANASNQRNMPTDEPMRTACAETKGGHFALVAPVVVNTVNGKFDEAPSRSNSAEEPIHTVTASQKFGLAAATLIQTGYGEREGQDPRALDPDRPLGTIVAGGGKHAVVTGTLVHTAHGEADSQGNPRRGRGAHDLGEAVPTLTTSKDLALAAASMVKMRGTNIGDEVDAPLHTVSAGGTHHAVVAACLAQHNGGFNTVDAAASLIRHFGESVGQSVDEPCPTTVAGGGGKTGLIAAHMTKFNTGSVGSEMTEPLPTVTAGSHRPETHGGAASTHGLIAASAALYYGSEQDGQALDEAARTCTTKPRIGLVESHLAYGLTEEQLAGALRVAAFLREHDIEFEGELATITDELGQVWVIVDIGMRMLTPRELFRAQGFPESYIIDEAWLWDPETSSYKTVALTKEQQIRMCGNSVCPDEAAALVRANVPELIIHRSPPSTKSRRKPQLQAA